MTNGDHIRSMSDEELATNQHVLFNGACEMHNNEENAVDCKRTEWAGDLSPCAQCTLKWLKEPMKGESAMNEDQIGG